MKKTKIIIFMFSLGGGGIQKFVTNLINNMNKDQFDINLAVVNKKGVYLEGLPKEVKLIDLKAKRVHFALFPLIKTLKKEEVDVLFCVGTNINLVGIMAKILSKSKARLIIRQAVDINKSSTKKFTLLLMKILYPKVDKCIVLTNKMKNTLVQFLNLSESQMQVIYNAIDIQEISFKRKEKINTEIQQIKEPIITTVGRLTKQKNQLMLIDAFEIVLKKHQAKLIILGDGEDKRKIEEKIIEKNLDGNVLMLGYKDNPYKYLYNSDIFVLPSIYEGLSNALLEALACDIPIVTTDNPDLIIKDKVNGFYVENNKLAIAEKILLLLEDENLYQSIVANNIAYKNNFEIKIMVDNYKKLFSEPNILIRKES